MLLAIGLSLGLTWLFATFFWKPMPPAGDAGPDGGQVVIAAQSDAGVAASAVAPAPGAGPDGGVAAVGSASAAPWLPSRVRRP